MAGLKNIDAVMSTVRPMRTQDAYCGVEGGSHGSSEKRY